MITKKITFSAPECGFIDDKVSTASVVLDLTITNTIYE
jgi:hypothetical protein